MSSSGGLALGAVEQAVGLLGAEAEAHEPLRAPASGELILDCVITISSCGCAATFSRSSTMIRSAVRLPMPGTAWNRAVSLLAIALSSSRGRAAREHREGHLGTDALNADQHEEEVTLVLSAEAVEVHPVVAQDQMGVEQRVLPGRGHLALGLGGHRKPVADPGRLHDHVVGVANQNRSPDRCDHASAAFSGRAVRVADGDRQGVGSMVLGRRLGERKQRADHALDLALVGATRSRTRPA